jgi:hypothetical protein
MVLLATERLKYNIISRCDCIILLTLGHHFIVKILLNIILNLTVSFIGV